MTTDREALAALLDAIDDHYGAGPVPVPIAAAAGDALRHLLVSTARADCAAEVDRASRAAYAAGAAHGVGARPDQRPGATVDP